MVTHRARCQQPANDRPAGNNVRAELFVRRVNDSADVADEVTPQRLTFCCGEILTLEPLLVVPLTTKLYLHHTCDQSDVSCRLTGRLPFDVNIVTQNTCKVNRYKPWMIKTQVWFPFLA